MARKKRKHHLHHEPILHPDHPRPYTRRDFLSAGLISGSAMVVGPSLLSLLHSSKAYGYTAADCNLSGVGNGGKVPFICFDLGGGANMSGSNVLIGGPAGQLDFLSTAGYSKMGLPGDRIPKVVDPVSGATDQVNEELGLRFHADSAFLRGILSKTSITTRANVNGAVIPARSDNDTGNNPHNPMYGIAKAGAAGRLLTLVGTANSDSGGRSMAPAGMIDLEVRPTKVDRASDATGLVDTGDLGTLMPNTAEAGAVMDTIEKISANKFTKSDNPDKIVDPDPANNPGLQKIVQCNYHKTTYTVTNFGDISAFDPLKDERIVPVGGLTAPTSQTNQTATPTPLGSTESIFNTSELDPTNAGNNSLFGKTAAVMKLVCNGLAGAGTIEAGGYDYHDGTRTTGEIRDYRAGQAMGACLEYAARVGTPLMIYVFSDGSLASNGRIDDSADGRGKGQWTGDNSSTAASFFLVYNPANKPVLLTSAGKTAEQHRQLGYMRSDGSVETSGTTPGANNVNLLAEMAILNYMALHGDQGQFQTLFGNSLGTNLDSWIAFEPIV